MTQVKWGIIGPGNIAANFAQGLVECDSGILAGVASRDGEKSAAFGATFGVDPEKCFASYDALLADPDIQAVYIATPNPFHTELAIRSMRANKHVLVEKPAGLIPGEVVAMTEVAAQQGVFFMEGLMYRCHPQIARVVEIIWSGEIGEVQQIDASFGFASTYNPDCRLDAPELAGGAILDVGVYPISLARLFAGAAMGKAFADPVAVKGTGTLNPRGVDETAHAVLRFENGIIAICATSIRRNMSNNATIIGSKGSIHIPDPWVPGRNAGPSDTVINVVSHGVTREEVYRHPWMLFAHEAELASRDILDGKTQAQSPAASWADSIGNAKAITDWRAQAGYYLPGEAPATIRRLPATMASGLPNIPRLPIDGMSGEITKLIMGCDNRDTLDEGSIVWDAWWEAGGNGFDTGFVYGGGLHEKLLGDWMSARGVSKEARVIVKGAHSPYCVPDAIAVQLEISLERLKLDRAPIYIMHRDNPNVPVSEFVDALNDLHAKGLIGAFGGSNWSVARYKEAVDYANCNGLRAPTILNNNLSLAVMEKLVWEGCITSNTPEILNYLRESNTTHVSWSSQARGYFLRPGEGTALSSDTAPDVCFASIDNAERKRRAQELAAKFGVETHNIATAWVLAQSFPSLALIGARSPGEISSTLRSINVALGMDELAWLNLEGPKPTRLGQ